MDDDDIRRILDYATRTRHWGTLPQPDVEERGHNGGCGDELMVQLKVENDRIADMAFSGVCCALTRATASMTAERAIGKPVEYLATLNRESVLDLIGVPIAAPRMRCALLHLEVLHSAALGPRST